MDCTYEEFLVYLLLTASYSDMEYDYKEESIIRKIVDQKTYQKIYKEFNEDSDFQRIEKITACKPDFFPTEEKKQAILDHVVELFKADGHYTIMEKNLMRFLKKLM